MIKKVISKHLSLFYQYQIFNKVKFITSGAMIKYTFSFGRNDISYSFSQTYSTRVFFSIKTMRTMRTVGTRYITHRTKCECVLHVHCRISMFIRCIMISFTQKNSNRDDKVDVIMFSYGYVNTKPRNSQHLTDNSSPQF